MCFNTAQQNIMDFRSVQVTALRWDLSCAFKQVVARLCVNGWRNLCATPEEGSGGNAKTIF